MSVKPFAPFQTRLEKLQNSFNEFEDVCTDLNFTKLVDALKNKGQSTIQNPNYLNNLTLKTILKDISVYSSEQLTKFAYKITDKEKLLLLYGFYHNYCWRIFDQLYNRMNEGSLGEFCAGGTEYSQHSLMEECSDFLKTSQHKSQKHFYENILDNIEAIRDRLHSYKEAIIQSSKTLNEYGALLKISHVVSTNHFDNKYFASIQFDCNEEFRFQYKNYLFLKGEIDLSPMKGANRIEIQNLRKIIDTIFKIPKKGRLRKNSKKSKLYLYF